MLARDIDVRETTAAVQGTRSWLTTKWVTVFDPKRRSEGHNPSSPI
jgi:hypothetical protein